MSWFHAPLLTPAQGFVFLIVLIAIQVLSYLFVQVWRDGGKAKPDPLSDHYEELASARFPQEPPTMEARR